MGSFAEPLGRVRFGGLCGYAIPESTQGIEGVVENLILLDVITVNAEQFFDASKDCLLRSRDPFGDQCPVVFKQGCLVQRVPADSRMRGISERALFHGYNPWVLDQGLYGEPGCTVYYIGEGTCTLTGVL